MTLLNDIDVGGTKYKYANSIPMGTCATPAGSEVKECAFADSFELAVGNLISVTFTYANTYGNGSTTYPKLLINGTQYPVKQPVGGYASSGAWANGQAVTFMFDGTNLVFLTVPVVDTVANGNMNSVSSNAVFNALGTRVPLVEVRAENNFDSIQSILDYFGSAAGRSLVPEGGAVVVKLGFTGGGGWHNIFICSTNNNYFSIVIFSYYFPLQCWQYSLGNWQPFNYAPPST